MSGLLINSFAGVSDPPYATQIMNASPTAYWKFGETVSPVPDQSGNGHTATVQAGSALTYSNSGPEENSVRQTGTARFNTPVGLSIGGAGHYMMMASVYPEAAMNDRCLFGAWSGNGVMFYIDNSGVGAGELLCGHGANVYYTGIKLALNTWSHIMAGWDGTNSQCWINGTRYVNTAVATGTTARTAPQVGTYDSRAGSSWVGRYQHIAYFSGAAADALLTTAQAVKFSAAAR